MLSNSERSSVRHREIEKLGADAVFRRTTEVKSQILGGNLSVAQIMELLRTSAEAALHVQKSCNFSQGKDKEMATTRHENGALRDLLWLI